MRADDEAYLLDKVSVSVWPLDPVRADTVSNLIEWTRVLPPDSPEWPQVVDVFDQLLGQPSAFPSAFTVLEAELDEEAPLAPSVGVLPKLAVNVANDCNLGCSYCYANEGLYGSGRGMLSPADAEAIADRVAGAYDTVGTVQFMGGEPTMNLPAMEAVAAAFERAVSDGRLSAPPEYTTVTNGVHFSRRFLDFCVQHGVQLTVSLDGPQEVHDAARPRKDGRGSYDLVRRGADAAKEAGITVGFEPTFSRAHLRQGMSLVDLCQWFSDEYEVAVLHAPPMSANRYLDPREDLGLSVEEKVEQFCGVSRWGIRNLLERGTILMHDYTARVLVSLSGQQTNTTICPAGNSQLSVSLTGELSPCWMFTDEPEYSLGSIWGDGPLLDEAAVKRLKQLDQLELHSHPVCRACPVQPVCFGCKGGDFHESGDTAGKPNCDYVRAIVATCISEVFQHARHAAAFDDWVRSTPTFGERVWRDIVPDLQRSPTAPARRSVSLPFPSVRTRPRTRT